MSTDSEPEIQSKYKAADPSTPAESNLYYWIEVCRLLFRGHIRWIGFGTGFRPYTPKFRQIQVWRLKLNAGTAYDPQRREVHFEGHVQGVGFRYTTVRIAGGYRVTGFVRNLPDGRVQLVAEGILAELDGFLAEVEQAMESKISDRTTALSTATGEFPEFSIA